MTTVPFPTKRPTQMEDSRSKNGRFTVQLAMNTPPALPSQNEDPDFDSLVAVTLEIAKKRRRLFADLQRALEAGTDAEVRAAARRLCGMSPE